MRYDNGDTLGVTGTHPLYSLDRQQFIPTEDIKVGEQLSKSGIITVVSKTYDPTPQEVYNLEVGQWHNFLVGSSGVVVHNSYLDDLLKNKRFSEIYQPLKDGSHIRKYSQYGLLEEEEAILKLYVEDGFYKGFDNALTGKAEMTAEYIAARKFMTDAINKLPKEKGKLLFRGAGQKESEFAKTLAKGDEFDFNGKFASSSSEEFIADQFRRGGGGDVIWEITSKKGVSLQAINSSEAEVLFQTLTKFKLIGIRVKSTPNFPDVFIYTIKEL